MPSVLNNNNSIVGIILAGGKSTRMGRDKAMLSYKGKRLIDHMRQILEAANVKRIYVSGRVEGFHSIPDESAHQGPVGGIYSVACYFRAETDVSLLILPVDMPLLTAELCKSLIEQSEQSEAVCYADKPLPLLVKNSPEFIKLLTSQLDKSDKKSCSVRGILKAIKTTELPLSHVQEKYFTNVNTRGEWESLLSGR